MENKKVEYPMILCPESMQESDKAKKNDLASHNWFSENKSPKNKKENKVQWIVKAYIKHGLFVTEKCAIFESIELISKSQLKNQSL